MAAPARKTASRLHGHGHLWPSFLGGPIERALHDGATPALSPRNAYRVSDEDRSTSLSFLSGGGCQGYAPQCGDITGILKQSKDEMSIDLTTRDLAVSGEYHDVDLQ